jgi:hypothetical protein
MTLTTRLGLSAASLVLSTLAVTGCKKDDPPPPLPSAAPVATAPAPLQLRAEDAGVKAPVDAGKKKTGGPGGGGGLGPCCKALEQNAASAPPPNNGYMLQAAATCRALNAQGAPRASMMNALAMLKAYGIPAACK